MQTVTFSSNSQVFIQKNSKIYGAAHGAEIKGQFLEGLGMVTSPASSTGDELQG